MIDPERWLDTHYLCIILIYLVVHLRFLALLHHVNGCWLKGISCNRCAATHVSIVVKVKWVLYLPDEAIGGLIVKLLLLICVHMLLLMTCHSFYNNNVIRIFYTVLCLVFPIAAADELDVEVGCELQLCDLW